jgi:hypothetical protein
MLLDALKVLKKVLNLVPYSEGIQTGNCPVNLRKLRTYEWNILM